MNVKGLLYALLAFTFPLICTPIEFPQITSPQDLTTLFPKTTDELINKQKQVISQVEETITQINQIPLESSNFENTLVPLDTVFAYLTMNLSQSEALALVEPNTELREQAEASLLVYENQLTEVFSQQEGIFQKIQHCLKNQTLDAKQRYLAEFIFEQFELAGQTKSKEVRKQLTQLSHEISKIEQEFAKNIQIDQSQITLQASDLPGLKAEAFNQFEKKGDAEFILKCDYPSYASVMRNCTSHNTRKDYFSVFNKRAYPSNQNILNQLIEKRDQYAQLMGYSSYNELSLKSKMVKSPQNATSFLQNLHSISKKKQQLEFIELTHHLPEGVELSENGKLYAWDESYARQQYLKNNYEVDSEQIAEYFPFQKTFDGLMSIYEQFFDIRIEEVKAPKLWHSDVRLLEIKEPNGQMIGYVLLDLFPRDQKYSHACDVPSIALNIKKDGHSYPGVDLIVANFTKPTPETPSLLKHSEVTTLFHEFGHALHDLFASQPYASLSGIGTSATKTDFVELPSQLLEEWMWQSSILKKISSHYSTNEPLPDSLIEKMLKAKNVSSGTFIQRQTFLSFLALNYFSEGADKNTHQICKELRVQLCPNIEPYDDYFYLSFGHLTGYGPCYYGYMWSKVFALDVFDHIRSQGILDPKVGKKYREQVLAKGSSQDPNEILIEYLGRPPSFQAFKKELDLN